jgi:aminopeptidase N
MNDIPEVKSLLWLAQQFPAVEKPQNDIDRMQNCIHRYCINAVNLINRQKAEIDSLRESAEIARQNAVNTSRAMQNIAKATRAEAIKGFAEKTDKIITEIYNKFIFGDYDLGDEAREAIMDFCVDISHAINNLV